RLAALIPSRAARVQAQHRAAPRLRVVKPDEPEDREIEAEPVPATVQAPARTAGAPDEQLEARVDRLLEKVSKHGQESLTPEERELLFRASELYKSRRKGTCRCMSTAAEAARWIST